MSFSFLVEDGTGLPGATSYISVADADDYLTQNTHAFAAWNALPPTTTKEYLLVWASRYIDQRTRWNGELMKPAVLSNGVLVTPGSGLRWPRKCVTDREGNPVATNIVPIPVKQATAEMARYLIDVDRSVERGSDGLKEIQVDVVKLIFDDTYRLPAVPTQIRFILDGLGFISSGAPNFARIRKA